MVTLPLVTLIVTTRGLLILNQSLKLPMDIVPMGIEAMAILSMVILPIVTPTIFTRDLLILNQRLNLPMDIEATATVILLLPMDILIMVILPMVTPTIFTRDLLTLKLNPHMAMATTAQLMAIPVIIAHSMAMATSTSHPGA